VTSAFTAPLSVPAITGAALPLSTLTVALAVAVSPPPSATPSPSTRAYVTVRGAVERPSEK
jgi:hypothetical protein